MSAIDNNKELLNKLSTAINARDRSLLTNYDIYQLFSAGYSPRLMLYTITAMIIQDESDQPLLSPDMLLIQCLNGVRKYEDCILVGLALRYKANSNMYINDPKYGSSEVHLLVYAYTRLHENKTEVSVTNRCIGLLMAAGALTTSSSFGQKSLLYDNTQTIGDWFRIQGYVDWEQIQGAGAGVSEKFVHDLAIYLDDDSHIKEKPLFSDLVRAHDGHILDKLIDKYTEKDLDQAYVICIEHYNVQAFGYALTKLPSPSYVLINDIILRMKLANRADDIIVVAQFRDMLKMAISHGAYMDLYQLDEIKSVSISMAEGIVQTYAEPMWEKDCRNLYSNESPQLRELAFNLGLNIFDNKRKMCQGLKQLAGSPKDKVIAAAIKRKREIISSRVADTSTVLGNNEIIPQVRIANEKLGQVSPLEYNDIETVIYTDQGGDVWLLTSDKYDSIVQTKLNPYTGQVLPEKVIQTILMYQRLMRYYNITPRPISQAVEELSKPMVIDNVKTQSEVDDFKQLLILNQVNVHEFGFYVQSDVEKLLMDIGLPVPVIELTPNHAVATAAMVINHYLRLHSEQGPRILCIIRSSVQQHYMQRMAKTTSVIPTLGQISPDNTRRISVPYHAKPEITYLQSP